MGALWAPVFYEEFTDALGACFLEFDSKLGLMLEVELVYGVNKRNNVNELLLK